LGENVSLEYLADPSGGPRWKDLLPGRPEAYFLKRGEGEHAMLFTDLFTVLLSGDETEGQFGVFTSQAPRGQLIPAHTHHHTHEVFYIVEGGVRVYVQGRDGTKRSQLLTSGDFGYVPAGLVHAYQVEEPALMVGVSTGGFERFFQQMGQPADHAHTNQPPFIPDFPRMQAAAQTHNMEFLPDFDWSDAEM
jgi:quercetin 2,3-dioxygenase